MEKNILKIDNISVAYSNNLPVLKGLSLELGKGQIVSLFGKKGAGKTTVLKSISGMLGLENAAVTRGKIEYKGNKIHNITSGPLRYNGIIQTLKGRQVFNSLKVEETLKAGTAGSDQSNTSFKKTLTVVYQYFPALLARRNFPVSQCSWGELQMLKIGTALMARPEIILLDEPSLGLAPLLTEEVFNIIEVINKDLGISFIIAEQNVNIALKISQYFYIIENGEIVLEGEPEDFPGEME